jgi:lipoprotein signal peptidase
MSHDYVAQHKTITYETTTNILVSHNFFASTINYNVGVATHNDYWLIFILLVVFIMQFVILIITRKSQYRLCML